MHINTTVIVSVAIGAFFTSMFLYFPNGNDVRNARKVQRQVTNLIEKAGLGSENEEKNAVLFQVVRFKRIVYIQNASPDIQTVLNLIESHRSEIDGGSIMVVFIDEENREIRRTMIQD